MRAFVLLALALTAATAAPKPVRVLDGDTIVVGKEHIRLLGIDAPEMPGHCRKGRDCAPGDPFQSKAMLEAAITGAKLVIHRVDKDRYGRTVADVFANGTSLSCRQLAAAQAIYWAKYDNRGRIAKECPTFAK
jgi:endonuclease YncB( thermonuclease family)